MPTELTQEIDRRLAENTPHLEVLHNRYELTQIIGQGAQGKTFLGRDRQSGHPIAVKEMQMNQVPQWEAIDLFEREAHTLKNISHPSIPEFIDFFHTPADHTHGMRSFLVQGFVDGENLKDLLNDGLLIDESAALAFLNEMLAILDHLHTLPTPVIHSDIKLSNIIRRRDQRLALIDFGAVQFHASNDDISPNTRPSIVGTSGYMPLEQMMGRTVPATDLYALAATTVHLLSRRHPADLPVIGMALQFQDFVNISNPLKQILQKMLAPHTEDRFVSAQQVLQAIEQVQQTRPTAIQFGKPNTQEQFFNAWNAKTLSNSTQQIKLDAPRPDVLMTELSESDGQLHLKFPRTTDNSRFIVYGLLAFFLTLLAIVWQGVITGTSVSTLNIGALSLITVLFVWFGWGIFCNLYNEISLEIDDTTLYHHNKGLFSSKTAAIPLKTLKAVSISSEQRTDNTGSSQSYEIPFIEIHHNKKPLKVGHHLPRPELIFLTAEIRKKASSAQNKLAP